MRRSGRGPGVPRPTRLARFLATASQPQLPVTASASPPASHVLSIPSSSRSPLPANAMSIQCPTYISTRSAEVILSDVRPIKLKPEALHSVNVLLDEILYSILSVSRSLATEKLKAALLKVLPTSLGKEALLEAEVELKAYWDRTGGRASSPRHSGSDFDLQWSFEVSTRSIVPPSTARAARSAPWAAATSQMRSVLDHERLGRGRRGGETSAAAYGGRRLVLAPEPRFIGPGRTLSHGYT